MSENTFTPYFYKSKPNPWEEPNYDKKENKKNKKPIDWRLIRDKQLGTCKAALTFVRRFKSGEETDENIWNKANTLINQLRYLLRQISFIPDLKIRLRILDEYIKKNIKEELDRNQPECYAYRLVRSIAQTAIYDSSRLWIIEYYNQKLKQVHLKPERKIGIERQRDALLKIWEKYHPETTPEQ